MASRIPYNLITVLGPTASGKTVFAANLAARIDGEIISADSRQVYKGMDIGTGKDLSDYQAGHKSIPYHLIDIAEPGYEYNVFEYQRDFLTAFHDIRNRNRFPVLCGGSGLYLEAVLKAYKLINVPVNKELRKSLEQKSMDEMAVILSSYKKLHNKTDTENRKRLVRAIEIEEYYSKNQEDAGAYPEINPLILGIKTDRDTRRARITGRLEKRLQNGMIEEVQHLMDEGLEVEKMEYYGLEYKYIAWFLTGRISYEDMFIKLNMAIHQYAKRQMTWFRKMEKDGFPIYWLDGFLSTEEKLEQSLKLLYSNDPI